VSEITELIDAPAAAYRERDLDAFLDFYSEDIEIRDIDGNLLMDRNAMVEQYGQLFSSSPNLAVEIVNRIEVGGAVIDKSASPGLYFLATRQSCTLRWSMRSRAARSGE
jgi:hypothetical protein